MLTGKKDFSVESLMPKGVEHLNYLDLPYKELPSVESLMPKGVEHSNRSRVYYS